MSWTLELVYNLLSTIPLAKKVIEVFLRKDGQPSEMIVDNKEFGLTNIIKNQYVI